VKNKKDTCSPHPLIPLEFGYNSGILAILTLRVKEIFPSMLIICPDCRFIAFFSLFGQEKKGKLSWAVGQSFLKIVPQKTGQNQLRTVSYRLRLRNKTSIFRKTSRLVYNKNSPCVSFL